MKKIFIRGLITSLSLVSLAACQDYDGGFNSSEIKKAEYAKDFEKTFGKVDPNQDWSMAQQINVKLDLSIYGNGEMTVTIFDKNPIQGNSGILYKKNATEKLSTTIDAPKGASSLFVRVEQNGMRLWNGHYNLADGVLSNVAAQTRAYTGDKHTDLQAYDPSNCPTTIDKTRTIILPQYNGNIWVTIPENPDKTGYEDVQYLTNIAQCLYLFTYNSGTNKYDFTVRETGNTFSVDPGELYIYKNEGWCKYYEAMKVEIVTDYGTWPWTTEEVDGFRVYPNYCPEYREYKTNQTLDRTETFYHLKNVAANDKTGLKCEDLYPHITTLDEGWGKFGYGYFAEQHDNRQVYKGVLNPDVEYVLGTPGPVTFGTIYGATVNTNKMAYFYWKETPGMTEEQKLKAQMEAPRFILMEDARPGTNVKCGNSTDGYHSTGDMSTYMVERTVQGDGRVGYHTGHDIIGTEYHCVYFGDDYNGTPTFTFDADVHVSFVLINVNGNFDTDDWATAGAKTYYGMQKHNEVTGHMYSESNSTWYSAEHPHTGPDYTIGEIAAVTYSINGQIMAGFEDGTDMDLNDVMFYVNVPTIKEDTKPKEITEITEDEYEWIVACEDLGSTDDYDFNDVVFGVKHYTSTKTMKKQYIDADGNLVTTLPSTITLANYLVVTPLAAGGTLKSDLYFGDRRLGEVHSLIDGNDYSDAETGTLPVLNAGAKATPGKPIVINLGDDSFTITSNMGGFKVVTHQKEGDENSTIVTAPATGSAPQMLLLPNHWEWPQERVPITSAYLNFSDWAQNQTLSNWNAVKDSSKTTKY